MCEQFKNDFMMNLSENSFSENDIERILYCLNKTMYNYDIIKKETSIVPYNQELPHVVKTFIVCKKVEGLSEKTLYNYTRYLTIFFQMTQKYPESITTNDIRLFLYAYQEQRKVSNRSLDKVRDCLSCFYKWLTIEGYIEKNPILPIRNIKYEKKERVPATQIDLEYLRMECKTLKQKAILEMLYSTGCRIGELVILKKSDVDFVSKTVHLFGKGRKHRTSFINAKAEVAIKEYLDSRNDDSEYLFVSDRAPHDRMHVCGMQKIMRELSKRVYDKTQKNITCHVLRHSMATTMLSNGVDITSIQKVLGHNNIQTITLYTHSNLDTIKADHLRSIV